MSAPSRPAALAAGVVLLAVLAGCSGGGTDGSTGGYVAGSRFVTFVEDPAERADAPVLEGDDLDGEPLSSDDFAGKTLVVNVWGSWCPPCRAEAPLLQETAEAYADQDVQFLGLNVRDDTAAARAFDERIGAAYPSIVDVANRQQLGFADSLPSQAIPTTWIIDDEGRVAARIVDPQLRASTLTAVIDDVLAGTS